MSLLGEVNRLGLELGQEALSALESLPYAHALELLEATQQKFQGGSLKDPTNYICATVKRGYVPRAGTLSSGPIGGKGTGGPAMGAAAGRGSHEAAAQALIHTKGMQKAEAAGLSLSDEAVKALLTVPASHASEILEAVAEKHTELRDPSNYVVATISRGYVPRAEGGGTFGKGGGFAGGGGYGGGYGGGGKSGGSLYETIYGRGKDGYGGGKGGGYGGYSAPIGGASFGKGYGGGPGYGAGGYLWGGKDGGKGSRGGGLIPEDVTLLEKSVLELNEQDLWAGQEISPATLLALRCIGHDDAMELLQNLQSKGMSKGSKGIGNLNNYIQAAIANILRDGPGSGSSKGLGKNHTGNQSRQKAEELGLVLEESTFETLAHMPLRRATALIEQASQRQAEGEDPNIFIDREASADLPEEERAAKRQR